MTDLPHDGKTAGEIVVRAPWLTQGYLKDEKSSEALWAGGYLHTADVASIDPGGTVQISDRIKDVIKTGGEWISSLQLEDVVAQHPAVSEVAVIGIPDERWGERPAALVVLRADTAATVTDADIRTHVGTYADRGLVSKFGIPDHVLFVDSIEKTSVGKFDKKLLRQKYR